VHAEQRMPIRSTAMASRATKHQAALFQRRSLRLHDMRPKPAARDQAAMQEQEQEQEQEREQQQQRRHETKKPEANQPHNSPPTAQLAEPMRTQSNWHTAPVQQPKSRPGPQQLSCNDQLAMAAAPCTWQASVAVDGALQACMSCALSRTSFHCLPCLDTDRGKQLERSEPPGASTDGEDARASVAALRKTCTT
jgi:hypothetical protein